MNYSVLRRVLFFDVSPFAFIVFRSQTPVDARFDKLKSTIVLICVFNGFSQKIWTWHRRMKNFRQFQMAQNSQQLVLKIISRLEIPNNVLYVSDESVRSLPIMFRINRIIAVTVYCVNKKKKLSFMTPSPPDRHQ